MVGSGLKRMGNAAGDPLQHAPPVAIHDRGLRAQRADVLRGLLGAEDRPQPAERGLALAAGQGVADDDLALPLGVQQLGQLVDLVGADHPGVVRGRDHRVVDEHEIVLAIVVGHVEAPVQPVARIGDLGQEERRLDRVQEARVLDLDQHDVGTRDEHVEPVDSRAALGLQLGGQLRGGAAVPLQSDAGVSTGEAVDHLAADDVAGWSVYDNRALLASGREYTLPLRLGTRLSGGRGRAG